MANQNVSSVEISGGPNRFELMLLIFDLEHRRPVKFTFTDIPGDGSSGVKTGSAMLFLDGVKHGNVAIEEFHITGLFMPDGEKTPTGRCVEFEINYSTKYRRGQFFSVSSTCCLNDNPAPLVVDMITWEK